MADEKVKSDFVSRFKGVDTLLTLAGALLIVIGSFLTWASVSILFGSVGVSGFDGDGKYTLIIGGVLILLAILGKTIWQNNAKVAKALPVVNVLGAAAALAVVVYDASQLMGLPKTIIKINLGVGMYVIAAGSLLVIASVLKKVLKLKKNFAYIVVGVLVAAVVAAAVLGRQAKEDSNWDFDLDSSLDSSSSSLFGDSTDFNLDSDSNEDSDSNSAVEENSSAVRVVSKTIQQALSYYSDTSYVVGELKNTSSKDVYINVVTASLYLDGKVVASGTSGYSPTMIKGGETVPYKAMITNVPEYDDIKVTVSTKASTAIYNRCVYFDIGDTTPREGDYKSLLIAGEATNNTNKNYTYGLIFVWLLDDDDKVLDVTSTYLNTIDAGASNAFEASFYYNDTVPAYADIKVIAESCY